MSYRNPLWGLAHAAREMGAGNITTDEEDTSYPIENMIDDRFGFGPVFKFETSVATHYIILDMAYTLASTGHDRLYIPQGHNLNGAKLKIEEDTDTTFDGSTGNTTTLYSETAISSSLSLDIPFTAQSLRYLKISFPTNAGIWEITQLYVTKTLATVVGPNPRWTDELVPNVMQFPNGDTVQYDNSQRHIIYDYDAVGLASAGDLAVFDWLMENNFTHHPFLLYSTDSTDSALVMRLQAFSSKDDRSAPKSQDTRKRVSLDMLEYIG